MIHGVSGGKQEGLGRRLVEVPPPEKRLAERLLAEQERQEQGRGCGGGPGVAGVETASMRGRGVVELWRCGGPSRRDQEWKAGSIKSWAGVTACRASPSDAVAYVPDSLTIIYR